ncbi:MAG: hypothetical protein FWG90_01985 [Oscillospiraceae bacterium]|nr:hypothetical protein [Oscillospiraceae bacterium]
MDKQDFIKKTEDHDNPYTKSNLPKFDKPLYDTFVSENPAPSRPADPERPSEPNKPPSDVYRTETDSSDFSYKKVSTGHLAEVAGIGGGATAVRSGGALDSVTSGFSEVRDSSNGMETFLNTDMGSVSDGTDIATGVRSGDNELMKSLGAEAIGGDILGDLVNSKDDMTALMKIQNLVDKDKLTENMTMIMGKEKTAMEELLSENAADDMFADKTAVSGVMSEDERKASWTLKADELIAKNEKRIADDMARLNIGNIGVDDIETKDITAKNQASAIDNMAVDNYKRQLNVRQFTQTGAYSSLGLYDEKFDDDDEELDEETAERKNPQFLIQGTGIRLFNAADNTTKGLKNTGATPTTATAAALIPGTGIMAEGSKNGTVANKKSAGNTGGQTALGLGVFEESAMANHTSIYSDLTHMEQTSSISEDSVLTPKYEGTSKTAQAIDRLKRKFYIQKNTGEDGLLPAHGGEGKKGMFGGLMNDVKIDMLKFGGMGFGAGLLGMGIALFATQGAMQNSGVPIFYRESHVSDSVVSIIDCDPVERAYDFYHMMDLKIMNAQRMANIFQGQLDTALFQKEDFQTDKYMNGAPGELQGKGGIKNRGLRIDEFLKAGVSVQDIHNYEQDYAKHLLNIHNYNTPYRIYDNKNGADSIVFGRISDDPTKGRFFVLQDDWQDPDKPYIDRFGDIFAKGDENYIKPFKFKTIGRHLSYDETGQEWSDLQQIYRTFDGAWLINFDPKPVGSTDLEPDIPALNLEYEWQKTYSGCDWASSNQKREVPFYNGWAWKGIQTPPDGAVGFIGGTSYATKPEFPETLEGTDKLTSFNANLAPHSQDITKPDPVLGYYGNNERPRRGECVAHGGVCPFIKWSGNSIGARCFLGGDNWECWNSCCVTESLTSEYGGGGNPVGTWLFYDGNDSHTFIPCEHARTLQGDSVICNVCEIRSILPGGGLKPYTIWNHSVNFPRGIQPAQLAGVSSDYQGHCNQRYGEHAKNDTCKHYDETLVSIATYFLKRHSNPITSKQATVYASGYQAERSNVFWKNPKNSTETGGLGNGWEDGDFDFHIMNEYDVYAFYSSRANPFWDFNVETIVYQCDDDNLCCSYHSGCSPTVDGGWICNVVEYCPGHMVEVISYEVNMRHTMRTVKANIGTGSTTNVHKQLGCMEQTWESLGFDVGDWIYYYGIEETFYNNLTVAMLVREAEGKELPQKPWEALGV